MSEFKKEHDEIRDIFRKLLEGVESESVLDVGGGVEKNRPDESGTESAYYRDLFHAKKYVCIDIDRRADLSLDLNEVERFPFRGKQFDIVIFSMSIEHLFNPIPVCKEIDRVAKKYILFGVPNMMAWDSRLYFLFGRVNGMDPISDYTAHHHLWRKEMTEDVIKNYFKHFRIKREIHHGFYKGGRFLPKKIRHSLANRWPTLMSSMSFVLLERKK